MQRHIDKKRQPPRSWAAYGNNNIRKQVYMAFEHGLFNK